jgi:N-methylhydantoinase B/oxoprolinase/acetone carboxylase alpha subunit
VLPGTVFLVESAGGGGYGDPRRGIPPRAPATATTASSRNSKNAKPLTVATGKQSALKITVVATRK